MYLSGLNSRGFGKTLGSCSIALKQYINTTPTLKTQLQIRLDYGHAPYISYEEGTFGEMIAFIDVISIKKMWEA